MPSGSGLVPGSLGPLVGALDQGTSGSRFLVFSAHTAELVTFHREPVSTQTPRQGWLQQDAQELLRSCLLCVERTVDNLRQLNVDPADIVCVGVTNQRESAVVWDRLTGQPIYPVIGWADTRTEDTVKSLLSRVPADADDADDSYGRQDHLRPLCGLPISTYFSAVKLRWLLDNVPAVRQALDEDRLMFGTVDSWLMYNLTGGPDNPDALHVTDVTNASRTMLMNIDTLEWDPALLDFFGIPRSVLPEIRSSSEIYGHLAVSSLRGVAISGCLGDQQAALVGQNCVRPGQVKNTYGTGCFMLYNVGPSPVLSRHGLLSTVAYQFGPGAEPSYALEGSVAVAGSAVTWLKDNMGLLESVAQVESLAASVRDTGDVTFVPAFSGLFAPRWRPEARGLLCGLTQHTTRAHICRAALEAVACQTREVLEAMQADCGDDSGGDDIVSLLVDGGLSQNDLLMQMQADILGVQILRPSMAETTALGVAVAAGSAKGIQVWDQHSIGEATMDKFLPRIPETERDVLFERWQRDIERTLDPCEGEADANADAVHGHGHDHGHPRGDPRAEDASASVARPTKHLRPRRPDSRRLSARGPCPMLSPVTSAIYSFVSLFLYKLADERLEVALVEPLDA